MSKQIFCLFFMGLLVGQAHVAEAMELECSLNRLETTHLGQLQVDDETRSIILSIDEAKKEIIVQENRSEVPLQHVMITQITASGYAGKLSVGLQRSSGNVVLQTYGNNISKAEFGLCSNRER